MRKDSDDQTGCAKRIVMRRAGARVGPHVTCRSSRVPLLAIVALTPTQHIVSPPSLPAADSSPSSVLRESRQ